ncbi:hypothetical protein PC121_g24732, partial [Phytophthora cactorum]
VRGVGNTEILNGLLRYKFNRFLQRVKSMIYGCLCSTCFFHFLLSQAQSLLMVILTFGKSVDICSCRQNILLNIIQS